MLVEQFVLTEIKIIKKTYLLMTKHQLQTVQMQMATSREVIKFEIEFDNVQTLNVFNRFEI